ncbi:MAG: hypothetical protein ACOVP1_12840 [Bacteroidia bacterium]
MKKIGYVIGIEWILCTLLLLAAYINAIAGYGLALSCDSANYLSVAENLSNGNGFIQFDYFQFLNAAPLYPLLLLPAYIIGIKPILYAAILNGIFLLGACTTAVMLFQRFSKPIWFPLGIPSLFFPFWVFTNNAVSLLSEMCFIFILLLFILHFYDALQDKETLHKSAILLALLLLTRFAGFLFVPPILFLLYKDPQHSIKKKIEFLLIAFVPIGIWMLRNFFISGNSFGEHHLLEKFHLLAITQNINELVKIGLNAPIKMIIGILAVIAWMIAAYEIFRKQVQTEIIHFLQVLFFLISSYILLLFFQKNLPLTQLPRFLSIVWLPMTIFWLLLFQVWLLEHVYQKWLLRFTSIFILALGLLQLGGIIGKSLIFHSKGTGVYSSQKWEKIQLADLNLFLSSQQKIISNHPDFIWLKTGFKCEHAQFVNESEQKFNERAGNAKYIVWLNETDRSSILEPIQSYASRIKSVVHENNEYVIFELKPTK